jgi:hypothetical protein
MITIKPLEFFCDDRLDLVCKYLLFKSIKECDLNPTIVDLYCQHILLRTNAIERNDAYNKNCPQKNNIDEYLQSAINLFRSMESNGFDSNYPIPYNSNGILNGAHRIACAVCLNLDIYCKYINNNHARKKWGIDWFINNNFTSEQIELIQTQYQKLNSYK